MQTYEAIRILRRMRNLIPEDELCSMIDAQNDASALDEAIEALRVKAGCAPRLPGYITIAKTRQPTVKKLLKIRKQGLKVATDMAFYLSLKTYLKISTLATGTGESLCGQTPKTCYDKPEPLLCDLPVIYGDEKELGKKVYLVTLKRI